MQYSVAIHVSLQEGLYKEQMRLFQELQTESSRTKEQKTEVIVQLQEAQSGRQSLEEKLQHLQRENTQLQVRGEGGREGGRKKACVGGKQRGRDKERQGEGEGGYVRSVMMCCRWS